MCIFYVYTNMLGIWSKLLQLKTLIDQFFKTLQISVQVTTYNWQAQGITVWTYPRILDRQHTLSLSILVKCQIHKKKKCAQSIDNSWLVCVFLFSVKRHFCCDSHNESWYKRSNRKNYINKFAPNTNGIKERKEKSNSGDNGEKYVISFTWLWWWTNNW